MAYTMVSRGQGLGLDDVFSMIIDDETEEIISSLVVIHGIALVSVSYSEDHEVQILSVCMYIAT